MIVMLAEQFVWHQPSVWLLSLLVLIPVLAWWMFHRHRQPAASLSTTEVVEGMNKTWRVRLVWVPDALRLLAIALMVIALARPQIGNAHTESYTEGIAIQMLIDRSGSMQARDFALEGYMVDRLTAVKEVANQFIHGNDQDLEGRPHDLIGIVSFARYADQNSPLTLDHDYLTRQLNDMTIAHPQAEGAHTAIGDAIGLAAERLDALTQNTKDQTGESVEGKIIILLTDGENNAGELEPVQAAKVAKALGIRIYTIGVASTASHHPFARRQVDEQTLQEIAQTTGGQYFRASNTQSLHDIYEEIDKLEKTKVQEQRFVDYRELALQPWYLGMVTIPPLLLLAFLVLFIELCLRETWLKRVPS